MSIVLLTSSILSPQYLIWMLPWVAIAASEHRRLALLTAAITILTTLIWFLPYRGIRVIESIILTRNVALVLFVVAGLWWLRTSSGEPLEPGERSIR